MFKSETKLSPALNIQNLTVTFRCQIYKSLALAKPILPLQFRNNFFLFAVFGIFERITTVPLFFCPPPPSGAGRHPAVQGADGGGQRPQPQGGGSRLHLPEAQGRRGGAGTQGRETHGGETVGIHGTQPNTFTRKGTTLERSPRIRRQRRDVQVENSEVMLSFFVKTNNRFCVLANVSPFFLGIILALRFCWSTSSQFLLA